MSELPLQGADAAWGTSGMRISDRSGHGSGLSPTESEAPALEIAGIPQIRQPPEQAVLRL